MELLREMSWQYLVIFLLTAYSIYITYFLRKVLKIAERCIEQSEELTRLNNVSAQIAQKAFTVLSKQIYVKKVDELTDNLDNAVLAYLAVELTKIGKFRTNSDAAKFVGTHFNRSIETIRQLCSNINVRYPSRDFNSELVKYLDRVDSLKKDVSDITN